jgi:hypothetical protein
MTKPDRALHEIARRAIHARSPAPLASASAAADAMQLSCGDLYRTLELLMGTAGLQALIGRSIQITAREFPWLAKVTPAPSADCALEGLAEAASATDPRDAMEGYVALLAAIIALLITFIGEDLTSRFVRQAWPKVPFGRLSEGSRE